MQVTRSTKIFKTGGSVALRLPAEFAFSADAVVYLTRDDSGRVMISQSAGAAAWGRFLRFRDTVSVPVDFMATRPMNDAPAARGVFDEDSE